jgi:hypothetical protein
VRVAVTEPGRRLVGWRALIVLGATVVTAFFLLISSRIALDRNAFVLDDLQRRTAIEESRYWELRLEAARLQAPERIIEGAQELGMVYPATVRTIEVPGVGGVGADADGRWIDLKALLGAQP